MRTAVEEINAEYTQKIEDIKDSHTYDKLETSGTRAAWKEVIAVYAVWKNMADTNPANPDEPVEVATMDEGKKEDLRKLFWEMNSVESRTEKKTEKELVEVTEKGKKVKKEKNVTKNYLYITTSHLDLETMMDKKSFTAEQKKMLLPNKRKCAVRFWRIRTMSFGLMYCTAYRAARTAILSR